MVIQPLTMRVIEKPVDGTRSVYTNDATDRPILQGQSTEYPDLLCGDCKMILVSGRGLNEIYRIAFKCPRCSAFNEAIV